MRTCSEIRAAAREALSGHWGAAALCTLVFLAVTGAASMIPFVRFLGTIFIGLPLGVGVAWTFYLLHKGGEDSLIDNLFKFGFKTDYLRFVLTMLVNVIFVGIGMCLLIVPGVILSLGLFLVPYLLVERKDLGIMEVLKTSWTMMKGYKTKAFLLMLSFIGWAILATLTFGIGFLWLKPYMYVSYAEFYEEVKAESGAAAGVGPVVEEVKAEPVKCAQTDSEAAASEKAPEDGYDRSE